MVARRVFMAIIAAAMISSVCGQACSTYTTCDTCVGQVNTATSPNSVCGWCVTSTTAYCSSSSSGCVSYEDYKVNGVAGSTVAVTANDTALEAYPQEFNVYLRKHEPVSLTISVKSQGCKKLDLYYLMDLSQSMLNDKNTLESLATDLSNKATELCEAGCPGGAPADCVSLGFGSFIDKPISPFGYWTQTTNEALTGPLPGLPFFETSSPAWDYVWRNSAPLLAANSGGTDAFRLGVSNSETRENIDQPESGLEALLQVAACDTEVGWRSDARRIVFYASDADFHIAGDGARAGIYAKNDGTCYVTSPSGTDTVKNREIDAASIRQDYPSISQLSQSLIGSNIVPIFAYKETTLLAEAKNSLVYPNLVTQLGFGFHGQLAESSGNVVALLESAYASISTTIRLETQRNGNEALVSSISPSQFTNIATDVVYSFTVTLEYDGTTAYGTNLPVVFTPLGFNQVTVHVTTQPDATCSCASNSDYCPALHCGNSGSCECGKCTCPTGSSGDNCECSNDVTPCRQGQTTCGGRGVCECGVCVCDAGFTGQFCDCSTASCPTSLTALGDCSGNGICECGTCNCTNGYTGFDCSCPPNDPSQQCNATICGNFGASTGFCATASGQCNTQQCECVSGWQIDSNGACSCQLLPCPLGPNDQPCNSQGTCGCGGLCQCNAGWTSTAANAADGSCDCDSTAVCPSDENGLECGGIGTCNCGTCECPQEYELPANSEDPSYACTCLNTECPSSATAECSGHGNCTCGVCVCEAGFAGSDCSQPCNVGGSCPVDSVSGLDCGGASQGTCNTECSYCVCERDWTGAACNCSEAQCLSVTAGECSDHGSCVCGACECDAGYGNAAEGCRCDLSTPCPTTALGACDGSLHGRCIVGDYDSDGRFQCGSCECLTGWSGTFCNCSTASCPVDSDGIECGPQGTCNGCGECECNSGWSLSESEVCDCEDNALCGGVITVNGTQVDCNGRGSCQCGISCECVKPYSGSNCELCDSDLAATLNTTCPNDVCSSILSCETCAQNSLCGYCVTLGACYTLTEIGSVCAGGTTALSGSETSNCVTTGKSLSQEAKVGIAAGVAGAIIGIGLLCIVIFKLAQVAADKREWKEWEKQRGRAAWSSNGNPLFQPNTKEFDNPLFQSKTQKASRKSSLYHSQSPTAPEAVEQSDL